MAINKKGVFFTLTAMMFVLALLFFIRMEHKPTYSGNIDMISRRISTMDSFIKSVESDLERALYISSFRAFIAMTDHIIIHYEYIDSVDLRFTEAFLNGTIKGEPSILLATSTFNDWANSVSLKAAKLNIITSFEDPIVGVYQQDPWTVDVTLNTTINYQDLDGLASWNRSVSVSTKINLTGFEDPVYFMNTFGRVSNTITPTLYEGNYTNEIEEGEWDVNNLKYHLNHSYYTNNEDAPSYLMRLEGNIIQESICCGIESLVNRQELYSQGVETYDYSIVDHNYWINQSGSLATNMENWFRIDSEHRQKYGLDDEYFTVT
ncbi:hypothetical protein FJZ53_05965 [Candidatus Woesearchaeota archaeon]|nr:hypothetical protein [Candidatus Woesearchaeota archaeon]